MIGGILTLFGILVLIIYSVYVIEDVVSKDKWNLDQDFVTIGGLERKADQLTGSVICGTSDECKVHNLTSYIPLLFDKTEFLVASEDGTAP